MQVSSFKEETDIFALAFRVFTSTLNELYAVCLLFKQPDQPGDFLFRLSYENVTTTENEMTRVEPEDSKFEIRPS